MIFIDGNNLYHAMKEAGLDTNIDFYKFGRKLAGERELIRIYYYNVPPKPDDRTMLPNPKTQKFYEKLAETPYLEVKFGRLVKRDNRYIEKGVDVLIAVDILTKAFNNSYDTGILVSGDEDFAWVIRAVKDLGKNFEVASFPQQLSKELIKVADVVIELNKNFFRGLRTKDRPSGKYPRKR